MYRRYERTRCPMCRRRWKKNSTKETEDQATGRSRGSFSTKIHLACDAKGFPLHFKITLGQANQNTSLINLLNGKDEQVTDSDGQAIAWPIGITDDKRYRVEWIDEMLTEMGITPVIPSKENEDRNAHLVKFDKEKYRQRNIVERLTRWLKECRRVLSRYEKTVISFLGIVNIAIIKRYLKIAISCL